MRPFPALFAALLLPAAQPLLLGVAVSTGTMLVSQAPTRAQSQEAVAKVAQAITVRIEGTTQGSGVLVKRDGSRYTVLTAWHVVSGQRPGEELDIFTADGQRHQVEHGSIKRLGDVDMAVLTFSSSNSYEPARVGDVKSVSSGSNIYVSGFPLPTSAVPARIFRFLKGDVIANATVAIPNGYQLLYSNQTLPGMSGGAALNAQGQLVGIHGQGETDSKMSEQEGVAVKTGTNQAVPITYFVLAESGDTSTQPSAQALTVDDYLAQAKALLGQTRYRQEVIRLTNRVLATAKSSKAYLHQGMTRFYMRDIRGSLENLSQAIAADSRDPEPRIWRGVVYLFSGDRLNACSDFKDAIQMGSGFMADTAKRYCVDNAASPGTIIQQNRNNHSREEASVKLVLAGNSKFESGDKQGAIKDYTQAIAGNPRNAVAFYKRCYAKWTLGDVKGVISDCGRSISIDPSLINLTRLSGPLSSAYVEIGDTRRACQVLRAAGIKNSSFYKSECQ